jgi:DNA gyrase/topoisomerase IV subunit A
MKPKAKMPNRKGTLDVAGSLVIPKSLGDFGTRSMGIYADEVNLARAVPDLIDGLKPVQRRILWAASNLGKDFVKTARLVGDVIGRYHPHGDASTSSAIVTLVQAATPPISGKGGWGNLIDPASAMRYTNCTLSNYGWTFFSPDYINRQVTSFVPNYDDTAMEPVSLPSMLPNVLINGGEGIGVGTTTCLPSFTPESLAVVIKRRLAGEALEPLDYAKVLKYQHRWGGRLVNSKENKQAWLALFSAPGSSVQFESNVIINRDLKFIEIDDWPQGLNPVKFIARVRALPECASAVNSRGATCFRIECRKDYNLAQFDKFVDKVKKMTVVRRAFRLNVTHRESSVDDGVVSFTTKYLSLSVPDLLTAWLRERLKLEKRSLNFRIVRQQAAIDYSKLLIFACDNLDAIFKALRQPDSKAFLVKSLKLTEEQADQILDLKVRQLSRLDQDVIKQRLKDQLGVLKQLRAWLASPKAKVAADIDQVIAAIELDKKFALSKTQNLVSA